ncbi:MAG: hypothetical protein ACQESR_28005 [Planctomycetota bacterium]
MQLLRRYRLLNRVSRVLVLVLSFGVSGIRVAECQAGDTWEYSPYQVRVWLAARPSAQLPPRLQAEILRQLRTEMPLFAGVTWRLVAERAPEGIASTLVTGLESVGVEQIVAASEEALADDKLMLLTVEPDRGSYVVACRELDCRARSFGRVADCRVRQRPHLAKTCARTVARAFSPLARVEQSRGRSARVRVRAGGLVRHDHSISRVEEGEIFRPVIRKSDRQGKLETDGIVEIEWTYLRVRNSRRHRYVWDCDVWSAMRNPLAGRASARIEKLALGVRPQRDSTRLKLVGKEGNSRPLEGYEVFAKKPRSADDGDANRAQRLGVTDWRGVIQVPPGDWPLRLVYVKNGTHLIARLPVVPGLLPQVTAALPSDDKRLEAEAFVKGMETTVMDLVARREILAKRIERRLDQGEIDAARQLLEDMKSFQTKDELEVLLTNRQRAAFSSSDPLEQRRIDQMLSGTRILLNEYLDPDQLVALRRRVEQAAPAE